MALTPSNMLELGSIAPDFCLLNVVNNNFVSLNNLRGKKATLIAFICNHCPYVIHINESLIKLANEFSNLGIQTIAISSNDIEKYPQDSPDKMKEQAVKLNYPFPYLFDESQEIAKAYDAACTPDFYLFDANLKLVYRGRMDDSRPGNNIPPTGQDLRFAIKALLEGKNQSEFQYPSMGCNIKWK